MAKSKIPYGDRDDIWKIKSNWNKIKGLYKRKEYSAAIVRAATAAEIAANLVIREELQKKYKLPKDFINSLLLWANGIEGKFNHLILPITKDSKNYKIFATVKKRIEEINKQRNAIVHSGEFKGDSTAKNIITLSKEITEKLVQQYNNEFMLR